MQNNFEEWKSGCFFVGWEGGGGYGSVIFVDKAGTARYNIDLDLTVNRKETFCTER